MRKELRSPLRYPGGKNRAVKIIAPMVPAEYRVIVSPFMGGGSLELHWAQNGRRVIAYDGFKPLVRFWQELMKDSGKLADHAQHAYPLDRQGFYDIQEDFGDYDAYVTAVQFFVLNRGSFSGVTLSGGCSDPGARFTQSSIDRLRKFAEFQGNLTVNYSLWPDTLQKHPDEFLYGDPPYFIDSKIYGVKGDMHRGFDHKGLAETLLRRDAPWLLSYNKCPEILELYQGCIIEEVCWKYGMSADKDKSELSIRNYR